MGDIKKLSLIAGVWLLVLTVMSFGLSCAVEQIVYYTYKGPIFPLSAVSDTKGIMVERELELDFSTYENTIPDESMYPFNEARMISVQDRYVLTNTTNEDITVKTVYPFAGAVTDNIEWVPEISVNENTKETEWILGRPVSEYEEAYRAERKENEETGNLQIRRNEEVYEYMISDETYFREALEAKPEAEDRVIVYKFKDLGYDGTAENAKSPVLKLNYVESENSMVLPYNWASHGEMDQDGMIVDVLDFELPLQWEEGYGKDGYLIVMGEDIQNLTKNYYTTGGMQAPLKDVTIEMERYETSLAEAAWEIFKEDYQMELEGDKPIFADMLSEKTLYGMFLEGVCECKKRLLSGVVDGDSIENAWYYLGEDRIIYTAFEVMIPANSSISLSAVYEKQAGHGIYEEDENLDRYDILPIEYSAFNIIEERIEHKGSEKCQYIEPERAFLHP